MVIQTERTILRPFAESDAADLFAYAKDPRVGAAAGWQPHQSIEDSRNAIRTVLSTPAFFAIVDRETGRVIGSAGFVPRAGNAVSNELGFSLSPEYWGRGIAPEAVGTLVRYGFEALALREVWAVHYADNVRCRRVLEKCGFMFLFQEKLTDRIGREISFYVLLRQAWEARERG